MTEQQIEDFRKMLAQLEALHQEMTAATKRGADKPINAFKVRLANSILAQADQVLGDAKPSLGFEAFSEDDLPTASDVSFIVTQYVECAEKVRQQNIEKQYDDVWYWKKVEIVTTPPKSGR